MIALFAMLTNGKKITAEKTAMKILNGNQSI
jgi:hypothetical protein